jgi:hypothetical protein
MKKINTIILAISALVAAIKSLFSFFSHIGELIKPDKSKLTA